MGQKGALQGQGIIYIFFFCHGKVNENHQFGNRNFCVHHRLVSAVKGVYFVCDRMSCVFLRGRCCNIIALQVNARSEEKSDDS